AVAAQVSASVVESDGVEAALAGVDGWLGDELRRAWTRYGTRLVGALREAAGSSSPTLAELGRLTVPVGVAACTDDPVHPIEVAREWVGALPRASLRTTTLAAWGADRESLGRAALAAHLDAGLIRPAARRG
ncbi:alpha/beta hydrolase, partial [Actinosynnema sp. NPDC023658]